MKDRSKEDNKAWVDEWICGGQRQADQGKMTADVVEEEKMEDDVAMEEEEVMSSAPSSPLRAPYKPDEHRFNRDPAYDEAFNRVEARYKEKTARQMKLPTLDEYKPRTRHVKDPKPLSIGESERKTVLSAAKFVVGVSSSVGGDPLSRGSGFWIDWDEDNKTGIVLTTADLVLRSDRSNILKKVYVHDAEVIVHMRDNTTARAHFLYYQQHYNLALFRVTMDQPVHVPSFKGEVQCAQEIFELGRDEHSYLRISHGRVKYSDTRYFDGYHCMNILGGHERFEYSKGGPVIDFDGNVVGMIIQGGSFMLSSILLKCLHIWRKFRCIPRPQLGLNLRAIRLLDVAIIEKISVKCNIDEGLIVKEVSKGSHAEKLGIRVGDVVECLNGERICNTFELENILLSTCEGHLERGNAYNSKVDIVITVFHTRKGLRRIKTLSLELSECKEYVRRVFYPFTIGEGTSASVSVDQEDSD
ncbi:uncharacterized protein LOC124647178 [Lolium rigidum]|uniref:uncharacterized protein LOC124647178 n=1 Tax=Lolium rigidum TaxID=89674 RepID=UPI001F5D6860|nr:uncharacterized protein LOC124647178 [Lolium rigidum]